MRIGNFFRKIIGFFTGSGKKVEQGKGTAPRAKGRFVQKMVSHFEQKRIDNRRKSILDSRKRIEERTKDILGRKESIWTLAIGDSKKLSNLFDESGNLKEDKINTLLKEIGYERLYYATKALYMHNQSERTKTDYDNAIKIYEHLTKDFNPFDGNFDPGDNEAHFFQEKADKALIAMRYHYPY